MSKSHSRLAQARTVLISPVPDELASEKALRTFASFVPGGIDRVWLYRDTKALNKDFEERQELCAQLEGAISSILKTATIAWKKKSKHFKKMRKRNPLDAERNAAGTTLQIPPITSEFIDELVPPAHRPTHRAGILDIIGHKVDSYEWCKVRLSSLEAERVS